MFEAVFFQDAIGDGLERGWIATIDCQFFEAVGHAREVFSAFE